MVCAIEIDATRPETVVYEPLPGHHHVPARIGK